MEGDVWDNARQERSGHQREGKAQRVEEKCNRATGGNKEGTDRSGEGERKEGTAESLNK